MKKLFTLLITLVVTTCLWGQKNDTTEPLESQPAISAEMQAYIDHLMGKDNFASAKGATAPRKVSSSSWSYPASTPATPFAGGTGSEADPYLISTAQQLANLAYMVNHGTTYSGCYFKMTNDIVLNDNVLAADGSLNSGTYQSWTPIGGNYAHQYSICNPFSGNFDGGKHYISGLYYSDSDYGQIGVFGAIKGAAISNLGLEDSYIYARYTCGGICGLSIGTNYISECYNSSTILGYSSCVGGILGYSYSGTTNITCCYNSGKIYGNGISIGGSPNGNCVGGICGYMFSSGKISYCYNSGSVFCGASYVGGISSGSGQGTAVSCYNLGIITVSSSCADPIWGGYNYGSNCYYLQGSCSSSYNTSKSSSDFADGTVLSLLDPSETYFYQGDSYPVLKDVGEGAENNKTTTTPIAGTGTVKLTTPYSADYNYSTTQMVYTPSEVTSGKGTISKIAFNVANTGANTPSELKIYMAHRSSRISSAASPITSDNLTLVYSGTPTLGASAGWETINLTTPFEYNGSSYLAVVVCRKSTSSVGNSYYTTKLSSGYTLTRTSDTESDYGSVDGTAAYNGTRYRPNIQFTKVVVAPKSISFANASETVLVGKTKTLKATINPTNAHDQAITWTSSNTSVATVSAKGVVTAVATGTTVITATTSNGKTATCTITVILPVKAITLSDATATMWVGATKTLTATVSPTTASNKTVTWTSSDTSVATVSSSGVITAIGAGTCTITCAAADGSGVKTTCAVTVKQQVTTITLSSTTSTLWVGKTSTLKATVNADATKKTVTWKSSKTSVATVSTSGKITAVGKGSCIITCTAADGYGTTAACSVTVKQQVTSLDLGSEALTLTSGTVQTLTPTLAPTNASVKTVTWKSTDTSVATITSKGVLTAVSPGTTNIICTSKDGFKAADTCAVTVTALTITDSNPDIAEATYGVGGLVYKRSIKSGKYAAFCLPYAVDLNDYTDKFSKVYVPMNVAVYKSDGSVMISVKKLSLAETIPAGHPFIVLAAKSCTLLLANSSSVKISSLEEPGATSLDVYDYGTNFLTYNTDVKVQVRGNYAKVTGLDSSDNFAFSTTGAMSNVTSVSPYRLYVTKDDALASAKVIDVQFIFDDEEATGIENILRNGQSGDEKVYNLKGQRVNSSDAQRGIYIINGKKVIRK